jgi:hypothetical protein
MHILKQIVFISILALAGSVSAAPSVLIVND